MSSYQFFGTRGSLKFVLCGLIVLILAPRMASALFLLEPSVGYGTGTQTKYTIAGVNYVFNRSSVPVGIRTGYLNPNGFGAALVAQYELAGTLGGTTNSAGVGTSASDTFTGLQAGAELSFRTHLWRLFAGYAPLSNMTLTPNSKNTNSPSALSGSAIFGGLSIFFTPHIGLDVSYSAVTYSSVTANGGGASTAVGSSNYTNITDSKILTSVVFPFLF